MAAFCEGGAAAAVTVTLHGVVDVSFEVPGFHVDGAFRAAGAKEVYAGKGVSCTYALAALGEAGRATAVVMCGQGQVDS